MKKSSYSFFSISLLYLITTLLIFVFSRIFGGNIEIIQSMATFVTLVVVSSIIFYFINGKSLKGELELGNTVLVVSIAIPISLIIDIGFIILLN